MSEIAEIAKYLMDNYYSKYDQIREHMIPTMPDLIKLLDIHQDKVVVIQDRDKILGVAVFLTLSNETYRNIDDINMEDVSTLAHMLLEEGPNIHFILLAAKSLKVILSGIQAVKEAKDPKTISWWDPKGKKLHKYNMN